MASITKSSTAEYFSKNLQQVGFSSPTKAVLTTLKEAVDNSLDACEEIGILPDIQVSVKKLGEGSSRNMDLVEVTVEDNGPGVEIEDLPKVFGEYLASSKFGRGRCSRGQQGIGISAATTWAQLTHATGVLVMSKTARMRKAVQAIVDVNIKNNKGILKQKKSLDWATKKGLPKKHGLKATFCMDGRVQLNGDGGLLTYLEGITLVNPHINLRYSLLDHPPIYVSRVSQELPIVPPPVLPHPHTMKLGEFIAHAHLYGKMSLEKFLKKGFSRMTDHTLKDLIKHGMNKPLLKKNLSLFAKTDFKSVFQAIQKVSLRPPSTNSVLIIGERGLAQSIQRLGEVDFFSVITRRPRICDFKPVVVEVAISRFKERKQEEENFIQLLRFANRVPLQFDKSACAITKSVESVNWRAYGLSQSKRSLPTGPYVFAVSVTSPFIKFKNASKETIEASEELVDEIRRALMKAGQKLSKHIRHETKIADLERKTKHIEKFSPILVNGLVRILEASDIRAQRAKKGLLKLLGRDTKEAEKELKEAELAVVKVKDKDKIKQKPETKEKI